MKTRTSPRGFSVTELLVVVSVIAVATTIGIPIITSVKQNAHRAHVTSSIGALNNAVNAAVTPNF